MDYGLEGNALHVCRFSLILCWFRQNTFDMLDVRMWLAYGRVNTSLGVTMIKYYFGIDT